MKLRKFFLLALIVYISIIQISSTDQYFEENDDQYRQLKRFFYHKQTTLRSPSVIENIINPTSTPSPPIWPQKTTYPPSGLCASNPCEHGGICTAKGQMTYDCKCVGPWRGIDCGVADACYNSPCQNGGRCLNVHDDYWCKCTNDFYGKNCQTKFYSPNNLDSNCRPNICNTGRCVSLITTYYCQCPDDRHGEHCEKRFHKRNVSKRQSFYQLLDKIKGVLDKQDNTVDDNNDNDGRAYYDFKNGIYF